MVLFVVAPVLGPVLSLSASSVFSGALVLTLILLSALPISGAAESDLPFPLLELPLSFALTSELELALALLLELAFVSLLALTSLLELALALVLELTFVSLFALASLLELALACELAGAELLLDLAAGSAGFAGALLEAVGAGALAAFGAGWLLEPPFALLLLPSPLPPIWWSLL